MENIDLRKIFFKYSLEKRNLESIKREIKTILKDYDIFYQEIHPYSANELYYHPFTQRTLIEKVLPPIVGDQAQQIFNLLVKENILIQVLIENEDGTVSFGFTVERFDPEEN